MIFSPDYVLAEKQARLDNAEKLRANLNAEDIAKKITNWAKKYSLEPEFVRYKVLTDDTFALHFVKDPAKQSIHQKVAALHIRDNIPLVEEFVTPAAAGASALYVVRGLVMPGSTLHTATNDHGKSIDFLWSYSRCGKTLKVFATHKYTKEEGGSQDNQFADVKRFLKEAVSCRDTDVLFVAICDGDYYLMPHDGRKSRLESLQEDFPGKRTRSCSIAELPIVWGRALNDWMVEHAFKPTDSEAAAIDLMLGTE